MKRSIILAGAIATYAACSVGTKHEPIEGQVFITLNNGESVKLGSVQVGLAERGIITPFLSNSLATIRSERDLLAARYQELKDPDEERLERSDLADEITILRAGIAIKEKGEAGAREQLIMLDATRKQKALAYSRIYYKAKAMLLEKSARLRELQSKASVREGQQHRLLYELVKYSNSKPLFELDYPGILDTSITDADGRFLFESTDSRPLSVLCFGTRIFGAETNHLFWLVDITEENRSRVLLSSVNALQL